MSMIGGVSRSASPYPGDWNGKPIEAFFLGPNQAALDAHRSALAGQSCDFEAIVNGQDLMARVDPFRGSDGVILGVIGIAQASTEQLVAERARRLSEQSCRSLIEEAPYSICRVTKSGQMLQVNPAMLEMLKYTESEEADLLLRDLPLIFTNPEAFTALQGELLKNGTVQGIEAAWLCSDGQQIQVRLGGRAVCNARGDLVYFHILAEDITERKRLEMQLSQSERMRAIGQLAGGVAHDFNNLLTVIAGQIEVVLGRAVDNDVRSRLEDARQAANRATALTRQLLAFSRRQVLQSKPLNLNACWRTCAECCAGSSGKTSP
jgi:PAS domain S-box-containing protein